MINSFAALCLNNFLLLRKYIRAEKDDDGEPHSQSFNEDQPIEGEPSAKAVKTDDSKILVHL